jgi:hypothetical protein
LNLAAEGAVLGLLLAAAVAGWTLVGGDRGRAGTAAGPWTAWPNLARWPEWVVVGLVALYVPLQLVAVAGGGWSSGLLAAVLAVVAAGGGARWWWIRRPPAGAPGGLAESVEGGGSTAPAEAAVDEPARARFGFGDLVAAVALLAFAVAAARGWVTTPDFVYHWGIKAERFALAESVDWSFLGAPANWAVHPDYPNLVPSLGSLALRAGGGQDASALSLLTALLHGLIVLAARGALVALASSRFVVQAGTALVGLVVSAVGLGNLLAGGADSWLALALLAAWPRLLARPSRSGAWAVGWIAAAACSAKIEGLALAGLLVAVYLGRGLLLGWSRAGASPGADTSAPRPGWRARLDLLAGLAAALPPAAVVLPWAFALRRYGLFQDFNRGEFAWSRLDEVLPATLQVLSMRHFYGFGWLVVALPLALLLLPRVRAIVTVASLQAAFYAQVYLSSAVDTTFWVLSSLPRLLFHLLPVALVVAVLVVDRLAGGGAPRVSAAARTVAPE